MKAHIELEEASEIVGRAASEAWARRAAGATEELALGDAVGRVLAGDVRADRDQPPFDRAAMDGYALRAADAAGERQRLAVVGEVAAGTAWEGELPAGAAVAIMTGAPVPPGADAVQMVERCRELGPAAVEIGGPVRAGQHIAPRGEDLRAGDVVARAGARVEGLLAGALASVGAARVPVVARPTVAIVGTGDELVDISQSPGPAAIRDSNRYTLEALAHAAGARVVLVERVADDPAALAAAVARGLRADVLVLSGGVSAGRYDLVVGALAEAGVSLAFHKVAIKPGKPMVFGTHPGGLVFGLPGNPVSTFVTGVLLLAPALRALGGQGAAWPRALQARLLAPIEATTERTTFHPGRLEVAADGALAVTPVGWNGSGDQSGFARGDCFIRREARSERVEPGERVSAIVWRWPW
ncbi:MAG: molybdopterin molybdotransferase MoeA [Deltaproteobacteria bacterium]|nr:molybdopterin molybdotransferase MoeA [Deltaproteobacteria bacterium]